MKFPILCVINDQILEISHDCICVYMNVFNENINLIWTYIYTSVCICIHIDMYMYTYRYRHNTHVKLTTQAAKQFLSMKLLEKCDDITMKSKWLKTIKNKTTARSIK